jgi:carbonic anhydrase/acetyltransferase-like protein (isoleucine patch superfamily)
MALIRPFNGKTPIIDPSAFIAENATIIGDVTIGPHASIWYGAVLRGDVGAIRVGARSNVQDLSSLHMTGSASDLIIGDDVVIGHAVILHSAVIGDGALVGMGSILLDDCKIGEGAVVAAGAVVPPRMEVAPYTMVRGAPAKFARELAAEEREMGRRGARGYVELMQQYLVK